MRQRIGPGRIGKSRRKQRPRPRGRSSREEEASLGWRPSGLRSETYNDYTLALEAAANGLGIAMGRSRLTEIDLQSGRLRRASAFDVPNPKGYHLVTPRRAPTKETASFIDFLKFLAREKLPGRKERAAKAKSLNAAAR